MVSSGVRKGRRHAIRRGNGTPGNRALRHKKNGLLASRLTEISRFRGIYSRIARKLGIDRSLVSRVARGERTSQRVSKALLAELHALKSIRRR